MPSSHESLEDDFRLPPEITHPVLVLNEEEKDDDSNLRNRPPEPEYDDSALPENEFMDQQQMALGVPSYTSPSMAGDYSEVTEFGDIEFTDHEYPKGIENIKEIMI